MLSPLASETGDVMISHSRCASLLPPLLSLALLSGCADDATFPVPVADQGPLDGGADAGTEVDVADASSPTDARDDVLTDASDTRSDASSDGSDGSSDTRPDSPMDADVGPSPQPVDHHACETAACWETGVDTAYCASGASSEDFSTGLYNVHRYSAALFGPGANLLNLTRTGGDWQPTLIVTRSDGTPLSDGAVGLRSADVQVTVIDDGRASGRAELEIVTEADLDVYVLVTGWAVVQGDFTPFLPSDATYRLTVANLCDGLDDLTAPAEQLPNEDLVEEDSTLTMGIGDAPTWGAPVRVDAAASEHIGFRLDFEPEGAEIDLELLAWDGRDAISMGITDAGPGVRVLAGYDPFRPRTFWARARGTLDEANLTVTRTVIEAGPQCEHDCGRLLQLPIPVDPIAQGYALASNNLFREQFGRRELLMALFHAGFRVAEAGYGPFEVQDISNWDGSQPCCHETHTGGYHVDISLLTAAGAAAWYDPGASFGDQPMALLIAGFFEAGPYQTGHPAEGILDMDMQDDVRAGADALLERGEIDENTRAFFDAERELIYHYVGHDNHIHVRVDR